MTAPSTPSSPWANVALGAFVAVLGTLGVLLGLREDTTVLCVIGGGLVAFGGLFMLFGGIAAGARDGITLADADRAANPPAKRFSARSEQD